MAQVTGQHHPRKHPAGPSLFSSLDISTVLHADPRPTFVVDIAPIISGQSSNVVYENPALTQCKNVYASLEDAREKDATFRTWLILPRNPEHSHTHKGVSWFGFLVDHFKVVFATSPVYNGVIEERKGLPTPAQQVNRKSDQYSIVNQYDAEYRAKTNQSEEELRPLKFDKNEVADQKPNDTQMAEHPQHELHSNGELGVEMSRTRSLDAVPQKAPNSNHSTSSDDGPESSTSVNPFMFQPNNRRSPVAKMGSCNSKTLDVDECLSSGINSSENDALVALVKFQRLAEIVDVGFFDYHPSGKLVHANESWYALSGHPKEPEAHTALSFAECVYPDDMELVMGHWNKLLRGEAVTFEMRWKKPSVPESSDPIQASSAQWVLSACVPMTDKDGIVTSIIGCTTDINLQKYHADVALQRAEALERVRASEERFTRFASVAPIAIFRFDRNRKIEYCNERWFDMTDLPKTRFEDIAYPFGVHDDDIAGCSESWDAATLEKSIGTIEFRLNKGWHDSHGRKGHTWVYCTFFPEFNEDGSFAGMMGSLLDISHLKWAENTQKLRAEEAVEAKRQQENFIDITSHEMRNPLSAMVQCADSIMSSYTELATFAKRYAHLRGPDDNARLQEHIDTGLESAQTILSCAAHQKRIVDDILTLSKLDSNLLLITPIKTQPIKMVRNVVKIFEMDCRNADIQLQLEFGPSFKELEVTWLALDPSRVLQILINLLTNAIKFTTTEKMRLITVRVSVSEQPPSKEKSAINYVPAEMVTDDCSLDEEWGDGTPIFLSFHVQDTGRGLDEEEKVKLFQRFSQASPKTHVQYGGSGLGLFISRKLTEMQGGEIGFSSESHKGSTFAFYVKTRKTCSPIEEEDLYASPNPAITSNESSQQQTPKRNIHVLLIEDNLVNQKVLSAQMKRMGCTVYVAGHGGEALDFLKTTKVWTGPNLTDDGVSPHSPLDIILMDIEMPVMGGLECTGRIRQFERDGVLTKHLPIISISANARSEQVKEATAAGVDDTITKPFRIAELMPKIQMLVT